VQVTRESYGLEDYGLPADYNSLDPGAQRAARMSVFSSWYDLSKANEVCTDVEQFVKAIRLLVEFYLKPAPCNQSRYYYKDPERKYDMVRAIMSPPIVPTEASKTLVQATRGFTKTETVIHQAALGIALMRPGTGIVVSEFNVDRCRDEIKKLRRQCEQNELIHADFGGRGVMFPKTSHSGYSWSDSELEFMNGSYIKGVSVGAAHRGRHPQVGIIDDPEKDEETSANPEWRRKYFSWLFKVYMGQFTRGNKIIWVGTPVGERACLTIAMRGWNDESTDDKDVRFDDWHKVRLQVIETDEETGERHSLFPEHVSVEAFDAKVKAMGYAAAMAEIMGDPVVDGKEVFERCPYRHGYMRCVKDPSAEAKEHYFLDLKTGEQMPWKEFLKSLTIVAANDIADSTRADSDPAVSIFIGISENGTVYVLDCWAKKCLVDEHVPMAFALADKWSCQKMGWEQSALQSVVVRWTKRLTREFREQGKTPPIHVAVKNHSRSGEKTLRIIGTLTPLMAREQIRFPHFDPVTLADDTRHVPSQHPHRRDLSKVKDVIDTFTDAGPSGYIDYADALEMAVRVAGGARGPGRVITEKTLDDDLSDWEEVGFDFGPITPPTKWTEKMNEKFVRGRVAEESVAANSLWELNPYE
jgi:hypothetical protein